MHAAGIVSSFPPLLTAQQKKKEKKSDLTLTMRDS